MLRKKISLLLLLLTGISCTTRYQVRGSEEVLEPVDLRTEFVGKAPENQALQISIEHQSIERYNGYTVGIIEISDDGSINPSQKDQVMEMVKEKTKDGGLLVVFAHGWHHGARVCDRDLCCFRQVLDRIRKSHPEQKGPDEGNKEIVGVYIGWRGESLPQRGFNIATLWDRKRIAEHIGRTAGREILSELNEHWTQVEDLIMVTVGHSLGGALVFSAVKSKLTGNISDITTRKVQTYRVVRAEADRREALDRRVKALRAEFGDLIVLVNPAIEASEYQMFDDDLIDSTAPQDPQALKEQRLPYDKPHRYDRRQLPVLMTIASTADTAVGRFFPPARVLGDLATFRWSHLRYKAQRTGMGRFAPHVTHELDYEDQIPRDRGTVSEDCGCSKLADGKVDLGREDLDLGSREVRKKYGKLTFGPTAERLARGWDENSPYLVVQASPRVIDEHSDIFNPIFVDFLGKYLDAYVKKYDQFYIDEDIAKIGAVDIQFHGNVSEPDTDEPGLPPVGSPMFPIQLRLKHDQYVEAWQAIYGYRPARGEIVGDHVREEIKIRTLGTHGDRYPAWILDRVGVDFALVDELQPRQEFAGPRFLRVMSANSLLSPFDSARILSTLESRGMSSLPSSLPEYLNQVVRPTLASWKSQQAVAIKLALVYEEPPTMLTDAEAGQVYDAILKGLEVPEGDRLRLDSYLLRQLAREAGKAHLVVHIQPVANMSSYLMFDFSGAHPKRLSKLFEDPALRDTQFVLIQGGWPFEEETCELLKLPNVFAEISQLTLSSAIRKRTRIVRHWLEEHPDKILFGSDASANPQISLGGWEESEWLLMRAGREALSSSLGILREEQRITRERAVQLASMVLRDNAIRLYRLQENAAPDMPAAPTTK